MAEIISKTEFSKVRIELKNGNKRIILCHGVFDLLHPGHIQHFQEAKSLGDILVVSVTAEKYVRKGPNRPYFNNDLRLNSLAAIACIDYVMLSEDYTVRDIIEVVKPDLYVKGQEYKKEEDDITGKITEEVQLVREYGGDVYYTNGDVFSSTNLINKAFPVFNSEMNDYLREFSKKYSIKDVKKYTGKMESLKVLVLGDVIIDEYVFCKVQGMMSKNVGYSAKYINSEKYLGGSIAIARHIAEFSSDVTLMSIIGNEVDINNQMENECSQHITLDMIVSDEVETIVKRRYIEPDERRNELNKIFVINNLKDKMQIPTQPMAYLKAKLSDKVKDYDVVFLCDFGHGLVDREIMDIIQEQAKLIVLNCQTNSSNYGLNLITKYSRADYFSLDQKELRLAFSDYSQDEDELLRKLSEKLGANGWLTKGSKGANFINDGSIGSCPAFILEAMDTIGAGDAFFALAGMSVAAGAPIDMATFLGNIGGALATKIIGNKEHLEKVNVVKYASTLLNI